MPPNFIDSSDHLAPVSEKAHAKVNLHLEVLNRRQDGYHNIFSLMAQISLYDLLKLEKITLHEGPGDSRVEILPGGGEYDDVIVSLPDEENLVSKAVRAFLGRMGQSASVAVSIQKNIPAGAGLGGGSSDAAASLRLMNSFFEHKINRRLDRRELQEMGEQIGADVPFCVTGGTALCEGKGEKITAVESSLKHCILLAYNGIHMNTAQAYRELKRDERCRYSDDELHRRRTAVCGGLREGGVGEMRSLYRNDFEEVVFLIHPEIARLKRSMLEEGADFAAMTGSGSSVFGLFRNRDLAREAQQRLARQVRSVFLAQFV